MKYVEYVLLTALTEAIAAAFGDMVWPVLSCLATVFTARHAIPARRRV